MADLYDDYPDTSQYFRTADLVGKPPLTVTVKGVRRAEMRDGRVKPAVSFSDDDRELLLNAINKRDLGQRLGRDYSKWRGARITLTTQPCQGPSGITDGIRIAAAEPADRTPVDGFDDPIGDVLPSTNGDAAKPAAGYR